MAACGHVVEVREGIQPQGQTCAECGSDFNLRVCMTCGHVGCCESQAGHNTKHARTEGHPIIKSMPLGRFGFTWCYEWNKYV